MITALSRISVLPRRRVEASIYMLGNSSTPLFPDLALVHSLIATQRGSLVVYSRSFFPSFSLLLTLFILHRLLPGKREEISILILFFPGCMSPRF